MSKRYTNLDNLISDIKSDIEKSLKNEVFEEVRAIELEHVQKDVLDAYSPKDYVRRQKMGIDDPQNIVGVVSGGELVVDNVTPFNSDYFTANKGIGLAELINYGNGRFYYDYPGAFERPRPFIDRARIEVAKSDRVKKALEKGMNKKGW